MTERNRSRTFLGLGGNLEDPLKSFRLARHQLAQHPLVKEMISSPLYRTAPVGGPDNQPDYLNAVLEIETDFAALELLHLCQQIETAAGRIRAVHWGPRTLDIDLLIVDDLIMDSPLLTLPHPRLHLRHFVLLPLNDLAPQLYHPVLKETIHNLLNALSATTGITRLKETW